MTSLWVSIHAKVFLKIHSSRVVPFYLCGINLNITVVTNAEQRATEQLKHDLEEAIHQWQNEKVRNVTLYSVNLTLQIFVNTILK